MNHACISRCGLVLSFFVAGVAVVSGAAATALSEPSRSILAHVRNLAAGETLDLPTPAALEDDASLTIAGRLRSDGEIVIVCRGSLTVAPTAEILARRVTLRLEPAPAPTHDPAALASLVIQGKIRATTIRIESPAGDAELSGTLDARSDHDAGGDIHVLGQRVALTATAHVIADGASRGGTVLIGGDYRGANPAVANAAHTAIAAGAQVSANALHRGPGGRVIVWADEFTRFHGAISARGGAESGDGGLIEVSGKQRLDFRGQADLSASVGEKGTLLLDPDDIVIAAASPDLNGDESYGDDVVGDIPASAYPGSVSVITSREIQNLLGSANLSIAATNSITVNSAITWSSARSLTLTAGANLAVNARLTQTGTGALSLNSGTSLYLGANISAPSLTLAAGGYIVLDNASVSATTLNVSGKGYDAWRLANFTSAEVTNAAVSGPQASNASGLANLVCYALAQNRSGQPTSHLPTAAADDTDWTLTYTRASERADLAYLVEYSTDLVSWSSTGVVSQLVTNNGATQIHRARISRATAGSTVFLRLRLTRN